MNSDKVFEIFSQLNKIPRASHHEEKVADFLCQFAQNLGLEYDRDAENCVVIRKPATPGHENAEPVVLLNHMDMVAVGDGSRPFNPLTDGIEAYVEDGWMKARGTSLGADNGVGLSMALAVLASDDVEHGPLEVLTTTNEEDGMSGASQLSTDFVHGRKVINLDSEDYDTITVGAAGAYLQVASFPVNHVAAPEGHSFYRVEIAGGLGGHSGVDINKGRINANQEMCNALSAFADVVVAEINGGVANASIPGQCAAVVGVKQEKAAEFVAHMENCLAQLKGKYPEEPHITTSVTPVETPATMLDGCAAMAVVPELPCNMIRMHEVLEGTVMTSNNIGMIVTTGSAVTVSCHTRSFSDEEMVQTAEGITAKFVAAGAKVEVLMNTPGWQENQDSDYMHLVDSTFVDVLGFSPRKVAMHFVLEAGYYVQKYPGIEIACIGPRIIEPHSTKERIELSTVDDIWRVLIALLHRMA